MRLIDADVLKEKVLEWMPNDPCGIEEKEFSFETDIVASLMMEIEDAPTIEPEPKTGEWINIDTKLFRVQCSACREWSDVVGNYCPWCGAEMEGSK